MDKEYQYEEGGSSELDLELVEVPGSLRDIVQKEYRAQLAMSHGNPITEDELFSHMRKVAAGWKFSDEQIAQITEDAVRKTMTNVNGCAKKAGTDIILRLHEEKSVTAVAMRKAVIMPDSKSVLPMRWATHVAIRAANRLRLDAIKRRDEENKAVGEAFQYVLALDFEFLEELASV